MKSIKKLRHSAAAYKTAKEKLERKFGGKRRQTALYLEELERFGTIRTGHSKDVEKFADLLDVAIVNLESAKRWDELGNGTLYVKLQRKLPESMLINYHR